MIDAIASSLQLEPRETRRALGHAALLFVLTGSYTLAKTARDALYLAQLPASTLPYVYLGVGVLTTAIAGLYDRAMRRQAPADALEIAVWSAALSLLVFAVLFRLENRAVAVAFYLWANFYGVLLLSQFWSFLNSRSHSREAKRIFGFIGVGGILGGLFGGLAAPPLASAFGLHALLLAAGVLVAGGGIALRLRGRAADGAPGLSTGAGEGSVNLWRQPYVRWLAIASLCSVLVATLVDFQFKTELQRRHPEPHEIASFLGLFYTVTNLAALTLQLFFTRWSLNVLGAGWSAAVLPTGLGIGALVTLITPGFPAVFATRLWDQVIRLSINKSAVELFFFPLETGVRRHAKAVIEAGLERLGDALAGILILIVGATMGAGTWTMAAIVLVLVAVWVGAWLEVRRGYVAELGRNLRRMNLDLREARVSLRESSMLKEMERLLDSPFERVVLDGLQMLEENAPERIAERLADLLDHPSSAVRAAALTRVGADAPDPIQERVDALLHDDDPEVRIAALRARWAQVGEYRLADLLEFVESGNARVRESALEFIATHAFGREEAGARAVLERAMAGPLEDRAAIARGLGAQPAGNPLHELLAELLADPAPLVRRAAFQAAGRAGLRRAVPQMIDALAERSHRDGARRGLAAFGDGVTGTLSDYLSDPGVPLPLRREIPHVLGDIATQDAALGLMRFRERDDVRLAYRVLKASNHIRAANPNAVFDRARVTEDIEFETRSFLFVLSHYRICPIGSHQSAERLLCIALNERMDQALNRMFRRLALLYPPRDIHAAYYGVTSASPRLRGNALEYLENALAADHRPLVLPLVDDSGDEARLTLAERYGYRQTSYEDSLRELLAGGDSWLRACALFVVGSRREGEFLELVEGQLKSRDPHVRETAAWARLELARA
jgi:ATP:ADP antiporter, AAA family